MTIEPIEAFIQYFVDQMQNIDTVEVARYPASARLYRKVLCVILLDTLSIGAAPYLANRNRDRFLNLVRCCTGWADAIRVSSQQLKLTLEQRSLEAGALYRHASAVVGRWAEGDVLLGCGCDPTEADLQQLADDSEELKAVSDSRYDSLLYVYRNSLLHEFREPGYGMEELGDDAQPFYHSMINTPWQLVFPIGFFRRLCFSGIWGVRNVLFAEHRNPYDAYPFGSLWRPRKA